jgi:hypothetical protein
MEAGNGCSSTWSASSLLRRHDWPWQAAVRAMLLWLTASSFLMHSGLFMSGCCMPFRFQSIHCADSDSDGFGSLPSWAEDNGEADKCSVRTEAEPCEGVTLDSEQNSCQMNGRTLLQRHK